MAYDFDWLLKPPPKSVRTVLTKEEEDARWAEYGRGVYDNLIAFGGLERMLARAGIASALSLARALRVYLTTGTMP